MQSITIYEKNANIAAEQFVLDHLPLVKKIALYVKRKLPSHIEFDDLLQSGLVGLLEARQNFNPEMGASFETFASIRIRGAIIDSLRKNSWVSRDTLKNMKAISEAISRIEQRFHRPATTEDIIKEMGISSEEHLRISQDINLVHVTNLTDSSPIDSTLLGEMDNPEKVLQQEATKDDLKVVLANLPEKEQIVLSLYYVEELTFKQIGEVLELTEARICQLHSQAIMRVRAKLKSE